MKKLVKVPLLLLLSLIFIVSACGQGSNNKNGNQPSADSGSTQAPASDQPSAAPKEPASFTIFFSDHNIPMPTGKLKELDVIKYMAEKTKVDVNPVAITHSGYAEQLKLKIASGDIPDVFQTWGIAGDETVASGKALVLNDLLKEYGPNLLERIPQSSWDAVTVQGKIMGIPQPTAAAAAKMIFVRKDWMDALNLDIPKTSDEFLDMLRAFRDNDPNGNKQKDEIPFSMRENLSWGDNLFGMFGVNPDSTIMYENEMIPGIIHPNMKQALAFFKKMYEEKLLDIEFLTNSSQIWTQKINSDLVGAWVHNSQNGYHWRNQLLEFLPDKKTEVIAIPTPQGVGYEGPVGVKETAVNKTYIIFDTAKNPEAIVSMYDWLISDEGQIWSALGLEGQTYTKNGDVYTYDMEADKAKNWDWRGAAFGIHGFSEKVEKAKQGEEGFQAMKQGIDVALKEGLPNPTAAMPVPKAYNDNPELKNTGSLWLEAATLIILGDKPLDYFDEFVAQWRSQGGNDAIKEMTDWYNENK